MWHINTLVYHKKNKEFLKKKTGHVLYNNIFFIQFNCSINYQTIDEDFFLINIINYVKK